MDLHAGFAAALSFKEETLQGFIHAGYVNNLIPGRVKGTASTYGQGDAAYDFTLLEPLLSLIDGAGELVTLRFELLGDMTFSGSGSPTLTSTWRIKATAIGKVKALKTLGGAAYQLGIDTNAATVTDYSTEFLSGNDPTNAYNGQLFGNAIALIVNQGVWGGIPHFMLTPPQLAHIAQLDYELGPLGVRISAGSLNVGFNIDKMTSGKAADLVDLNRVVTGKGWKKTFRQSVHTADDEYGEPIYESAWTESTLRQSGAHNTAVAVSLNGKVFGDIFRQMGRYRVFKGFENAKYADVQKRLTPLAGNNPQTTYEPSSLALTALDKLSVSLKQDYLQVSGQGSNYETWQVHADFSLKLRIVRTYFDGDTEFLYNYSQTDGITGEKYDVSLDTPAWVGAAYIGATFGLIQLPNVSAVTLAINAVAEMLVGSVVGDLLGKDQSDLQLAVFESLSGFKTGMTYKLSGTSGPEFNIRCDDIVVRPNSLTGWFELKANLHPARIYLKAKPTQTGTAAVEHVSWSVKELKPFVVTFNGGNALYNASDPHLHIQWQVRANGNLVVLDKTAPMTQLGAKEIAVDHASDALMAVGYFAVTCRVFRKWGTTTQELFAQELDVNIEDALDRTSPFVRWQHTVFYQGYSAPKGTPGRIGTGWQTVDRKSHIHYTDPRKRCRFADRYSTDATPEYLDALPFPLADANKHRKVICPYCFFGGPDKHVLK